MTNLWANSTCCGAATEPVTLFVTGETVGYICLLCLEACERVFGITPGGCAHCREVSQYEQPGI